MSPYTDGSADHVVLNGNDYKSDGVSSRSGGSAPTILTYHSLQALNWTTALTPAGVGYGKEHPDVPLFICPQSTMGYAPTGIHLTGLAP